MALKSTARSGFVYKPRSEEKMRERANRNGSSFDSIIKSGYDVFKAKPGDICIRPLPPTWEGHDHYAYEIRIHNNVGPKNQRYLCLKMLGKKCPVCEEAAAAERAGDKDEAKELKDKPRYLAWVLDRNGDDPEKPILWDASWTMDRDVAAQAEHPRTGAYLQVDHPNNGYDLFFKRKGTKKNDTEYYGYQFAREDTPIHDNERVQEEVLGYIMDNPIPDVLNFYDYAYIKASLSGTTPEKDTEVDEDPPADEPPFEGGRRTNRRQEAAEEPRSRRQVEEPEPRPTRRSRPEVQEDAPVNEEQEEAPVRPSRRQVVEEDAEPQPRTSRRQVVEEDNEPPPRRRR